MHVVDVETGRWRWKAFGENRQATFNLDSSGLPYLRTTKKRVEPWQADIGQCPFIRPFSTLPCDVRVDKGGAMRTQHIWDEGFLITEPMQANDTMLLFEVMNYIEERASGSGDGHLAHCVGLGWAFLNVDRALEMNIGRQQRFRLQLYRYTHMTHGQRSFCGSATETFDETDAPDRAGKPAVYQELSASLSRRQDTPELGRFQKAKSSIADWMRGSSRVAWPAVIEVSLQIEQPKNDLDRAAQLLNSGLNSAGAAVGEPGAVASAAATSAPGATSTAQSAKISVEEESVLAPHHKRTRDQSCELPDDLLWHVAGGERGASRLCTSPSGKLLAVAALRRGSAEIRIFRLESGAVHAVCPAAHDAIVYDLCWHTFRSHGIRGQRAVSTPAPQLLISCSGDGVVQLFEVPEDPEVPRIVGAQGAALATTPLMLRPHATLYMPSHVYSVRPHPALSNEPTQIVLACGGHGFGLTLCRVVRDHRIEGHDVGCWHAVMPHWQEQVQYEDKIANSQGSRSSDILCVRFSTQPTCPDNLYVSDSAGRVMCFQVRLDALEAARTGSVGICASFVRLYSLPELAGIPIYSIDVVTAQVMRGKGHGREHHFRDAVDDWLLLYSRDHIIRLVALQRGIAAGMRVEIELNGHTCSNFPIRGAMSPDGHYVACGGETGELFLWRVSDGKLMPSSVAPQVQLAGAVMDTVWSEHYHMLACCAVDDESPPVLVFIGGDPDQVVVPPPEAPLRPLQARELAPMPPMQPPPRLPMDDVSRDLRNEFAMQPPPRLPLDEVSRDLRNEFALVPKSIAPVGEGDSHEWAVYWANANYNPHSAVSFEEKRTMKERIINQLLDKKSALDLERHFAGVHGVPGGIV
jgi:WD40 repeat protein